MTRRPISTRERLRLLNLHKEICHLCGARIDLVRERWEIEHVLALELGGDDSDENRKPAHYSCHKPKTAQDVGMIRKADRQRAVYLGAKPRRPKSKWKRKVSGEVVLR